MQVYFDNAATTPLRTEVIEVMHEALRETYGNPSSTHGFGRSARTLIETARNLLRAISMHNRKKLSLPQEEQSQTICSCVAQ